MPLVSSLFTELELVVESGAAGPASNKQSVTRRFHSQLDDLIRNLNDSEPCYIRCIKPNSKKVKPVGVLDPKR